MLRQAICHRFSHAILAAFLVVAPQLISSHVASPAGRRVPGIAPAARLPTGRLITPAGVDTPVGCMPLSLVLTPDGRYAIAAACGALQYLTVIDVAGGTIASQVAFQTFTPQPPVPLRLKTTGSLFYGLALSPSGDTVYASFGGGDAIGVYRLTNGRLTADGSIPVPRPEGAPQPNMIAGLAVSGDGDAMYAACNLTDNLAVVDLATRKVRAMVPVGGYPLAVAALRSKPKVYVTSERDPFVYVVNADTMTVASRIPVGDNADALLLNGNQTRLYVANGNSDTVSVIDTASDSVLETVPLRPTQARGLPGATPTGLALSPDETTLYASLGDMNAVAVVDLSPHGSALRGYIPVGWYPTAVAVASGTLLVANGKGTQSSHPNPQGPHPGRDSAEYVHRILVGSISRIPIPSADDLEAMTLRTLDNNSITAVGPASDRAERSALEALHIKHVIYVIKENRTYDQILGDLKQGNGDPQLAIFGRAMTPNQHRMAEQFVLLDNFHCSGDVSGDGWNWSTASYANEYVQRAVPYGYSRGRPYDYEGNNRGQNTAAAHIRDVAETEGGYIWDLVRRRDLTYRNYGFFCHPASRGEEVAQVAKAALVGHTDLRFHPFDMAVTDDTRYTEWLREFRQFGKRGDLPAFMMVRLCRDHTAGTSPGSNTPRAMVADNDWALGRLVETVSHSRFWPDTAIFVIEDDAQNGPDHVDAHRSPCLIISPYIKRGRVDHGFYNTNSVLHTIECLLGLPPMSQYDATAPTFARCFTPRRNLTPFQAVKPDVDMSERNPQRGQGAVASAKMDFSREDAAPVAELNEIIWHAMKGPNVPMPAPKLGLQLPPRPNDG